MGQNIETQSQEMLDRAEAAKIDHGIAWHYTNGPGLLSILAGHSLWATSSWFLNDKEEVALGGQRMIERVRELATGEEGDFLTKMTDKLADDTIGRGGFDGGHFYILSASQTWDSLAMWRLYGGSQESYAIGIDTTQPLAIQASCPGLTHAPGVYLRHQSWRRVRYAEEEQRALVDALLLNLPERMTRLRASFGEVLDLDPGDPRPSMFDDDVSLPEPVRREVEQLGNDFQETLLLIKHEGFVDERETRYCVVLATHPDSPDARDLEARLLHYRSTIYGVAPFLKLTGSPSGEDHPHIVDTPHPLPIKAVSISPSPNGSVATASLRQLLAAHGYNDVPVLRSGIPFRA